VDTGQAHHTGAPHEHTVPDLLPGILLLMPCAETSAQPSEANSSAEILQRLQALEAESIIRRRLQEYMAVLTAALG
jgi:hypothetical protein